MPVRQVADGGALGKASRSPLEHPSDPPVSPFARHATAGYASDASSCESPRLPRQASLFRTKGSAFDQRSPSPDGRWPRRRGMGHRPRTSVWLLTLPAFLVLLIVASVVPGETHESSAAEQLEWQSPRSIGAQAIRTLSESLQLTTANWNADAEEPVRVFANLFEDMKKPGKQWAVEREYGDLQPQRLWNISYAAGPSRWTVGSLDAMCEALAPATAHRIAIVGNGPLTEQQRHLIQKADRVMRFNAANNMLPKERVDVWAVRYNDQAPLWYWGFKQLPEDELRDMLSSVQAVLFLDGPQQRGHAQAVQDLLYWFPQMHLGKLLQLDLAEYSELYVSVFDKFRGGRARAQAEAMPSSGLTGLLAGLACIRPAHQKLDLFGFNWSPKSYYMHKMGSEELMVSELVRQFNITVHPPACNALYSCDAECDDKSYRISEHGKGKACAAQMAAQKVRRELVIERRRERARQAMAYAAGYGQRRPFKKHIGRKNNKIGVSTRVASHSTGDLGQAGLSMGEAELAKQALQESRQDDLQPQVGQQAAASDLLPEEIRLEASQKEIADLGLDPRLVRMRSDVLALLTDGHNMDQERAVALTEQLRRSLEAAGHLQQLVLPQQAKHQESESQRFSTGAALQQQIADQMSVDGGTRRSDLEVGRAAHAASAADANKAVFDVDW